MKSMKKSFLVIAILLVAVAIPAVSENGRWWDVYFTATGKKLLIIKNDNPEHALVRIINNANRSFFGAFYDITSRSIVEALIRAKQRGIDVKLVMERDNYDRSCVAQLIQAGIPVMIDTGRGLMHNKFAIIDGEIIWTGSFNITENDAKKNDNNAIEIHSSELAEIFTDEFNEMFVDNIFGNKHNAFSLSSLFGSNHVRIQGIDLYAYFAPEDSVENVITELIGKAESSIHFMAFTFTSDVLGNIMIERFKRGVKVFGVFEKIGSHTKFSEYLRMKDAGIPVVIDKNKNLMHHKIIIIDGIIVIVGSYNYTKSANSRNDENILVIYSRDIAEKYLLEFARVYQ